MTHTIATEVGCDELTCSNKAEFECIQVDEEQDMFFGYYCGDHVDYNDYKEVREI